MESTIFNQFLLEFLSFLREMMAEVFIRCGNLLMLPNQLSRLNYDSGNEKIPSEVSQFCSIRFR